MIEIKLSNTCLRLDFSFFAVGALFLLFGRGNLGVLAFTFCIMHELSHLLVMSICGVKVQSVTFFGAGISIASHSLENEPVYVQTAILFAGSASNFLLGICLAAFDCAAPTVLCCLTGIINLLPIGNLDGARLVKLALICCVPSENVDKICRILAWTAFGLCTATLFFFCQQIGLVATFGGIYFLLMNIIYS